MTRLLVSVRDVDEALAAAGAGADFVDLKEPAAGALGGLPPPAIAAIVRALRSGARAVPLSATIGDVAPGRVEEILARVEAVARCGVDYVKVGIEAGQPEAAARLLPRLARCGAQVVPVLFADGGIDADLVGAALHEPAFPAVMLDTVDKRAGSLLRRVRGDALAAFVALVRRRGKLCGLAGSLQAEDAPALRSLAPDFAGFRGAVCHGERAGPLDPQRVRALRRRLAAPAPAAGRPPRGLGRLQHAGDARFGE
jgi:uncharacterized protein (UPF0264 family)